MRYVLLALLLLPLAACAQPRPRIEKFLEEYTAGMPLRYKVVQTDSTYRITMEYKQQGVSLWVSRSLPQVEQEKIISRALLLLCFDKKLYLYPPQISTYSKIILN